MKKHIKTRSSTLLNNVRIAYLTMCMEAVGTKLNAGAVACHPGPARGSLILSACAS